MLVPLIFWWLQRHVGAQFVGGGPERFLDASEHGGAVGLERMA